jgi:hypothetical protein
MKVSHCCCALPLFASPLFAGAGAAAAAAAAAPAGSAGLGELLADLQEPAEAAEYRIGIKVRSAFDCSVLVAACCACI